MLNDRAKLFFVVLNSFSQENLSLRHDDTADFNCLSSPDQKQVSAHLEFPFYYLSLLLNSGVNAFINDYTLQFKHQEWHVWHVEG